MLGALRMHLSTANLSNVCTIDASEHGIKDLIPLTAILLEYPIAYVPDGAPVQSEGFLRGVELEVFSCTMHWKEDEERRHLPPHVFMQFSCPHLLVHEVTDLTDRLRQRFAARITEAGLSCSLSINRRTEQFDRVAL